MLYAAVMPGFLSALFRRPSPLAAQAPPPEGPVTTTYFRVRTATGAWLAPGPELVGMADAPDAASLIAIVPDSDTATCFLVAPDLRALRIRQDGLESVAISARLLKTDAPGLVRLKHPLSPLHYLGVFQPENGAARLVFDTLGNTMPSVFGLLPTAEADLPGAVLALARELGPACARPAGAERLLAGLQGGMIRGALAETLLRLLPPDEIFALASAVLDRPGVLATLQAAMPGNVWITSVLPALAAWRAARAPVPGHVLRSPIADEHAAEAFEGLALPQGPQALVAMARRQIAPRRQACILATARNEGVNLLEWVAYHRSIGFEHIFLYTNDNTDGSDALLEALAASGIVTLIHNETGTRVGPQYKAYAHALQLTPQILDYRWTAVIDLDEFVGFDTAMFASIQDFIAWQETQPVDAVALCWLIYGVERGQTWSPEGTIARFPNRERDVNAHVKSLFRTKDFWHAQAHFPRAVLDRPFIFRNETGVLHHHHGVADRIPAFAAPPTAQLAWIGHYVLRTAPEALWKMARGRADYSAGVRTERERAHLSWTASTFRNLTAPGALVEDRRTQACAAGLETELAKLLALPGIAAADAALKAGFPQHLERCVADFLAVPARDDEPADVAAFRAALASLHSSGGGTEPA